LASKYPAFIFGIFKASHFSICSASKIILHHGKLRDMLAHEIT